MNAHEKGRENGFAARLAYIKISKAHFQRWAETVARTIYKQEEKQQEYIAGWMENWHDKPAQPSDDEILTY